MIRMMMLMVISLIPTLVMAQVEMLLLSAQLDALSLPQENSETVQAIRNLWREERQGIGGVEYNLDFEESFALLVMAEKDENTRTRVLLNSNEFIEKVFNTCTETLKTMLEKFKENNGGKDPNPKGISGYDHAWRSAVHEMINDISKNVIIPWIKLAEKAVNETSESSRLDRILINAALLMTDVDTLLKLSKVGDIDKYKSPLIGELDALERKIKTRQNVLKTTARGSEKVEEVELPNYLASERSMINDRLKALRFKTSTVSQKYEAFLGVVAGFSYVINTAKVTFKPQNSDDAAWKNFLKNTVLNNLYNKGILVWFDVLSIVIREGTADQLKSYVDLLSRSKIAVEEFLKLLYDRFMLHTDIYTEYMKLTSTSYKKVQEAIEERAKTLGLPDDWQRTKK